MTLVEFVKCDDGDGFNAVLQKQIKGYIKLSEFNEGSFTNLHTINSISFSKGLIIWKHVVDMHPNLKKMIEEEGKAKIKIKYEKVEKLEKVK